MGKEHVIFIITVRKWGNRRVKCIGSCYCVKFTFYCFQALKYFFLMQCTKKVSKHQCFKSGVNDCSLLLLWWNWLWGQVEGRWNMKRNFQMKSYTSIKTLQFFDMIISKTNFIFSLQQRMKSDFRFLKLS